MRFPVHRMIAVAMLLLATKAGAATDPQRDAAQWQSDLEYLVETLETVHPNLYARVEKVEFARATAELSAAIPNLSDAEIIVRMMQLVALVEDGHTQLEPSGPVGFGEWFPVRFYRFDDGIFVTAADSEHRDLVGSEVLTLGKLSAERAWALGASLMGADNPLGKEQKAPLLLSNATVLEALEILEPGARLRLGMRQSDGMEREVWVDRVNEEFSLEFQFWGEIWGPASDLEEVDYVTGPDRTADDHYDKTSDLPLHLRYRSAFWFTYLEESRLLYAQINFMGNSQRAGTFADFVRDLFATADATAPQRFVVDLRYNIGGDGSLVNTFVHELIKREELNRKGRLFAVVGRATYSAGVMLVRALDEHTEATFVGEPAGGYYAHYGDATSFSLPNSGLHVWASTIYHQLSSYVGDQRAMEIELPATFSSADYFEGRDPALEAIHASETAPLIANIFREEGSAAALAEYERRLRAYGGVSWWAPFTLSELNRLGHELLEAGRNEDAIAAYQLNTRRHPNHWRPWYSLARAYKKLGETELAIANYEQALEVDPFNNLASVQRDALTELRAQVASTDQG